MGLWYTGLQAARAGGKSQRTKSATCQRTKSAGLVALRCRMLSNPMNQFIDLRLILQNSAEQAGMQCAARRSAHAQAPALSRLLLPRLCAAALLCLDPSLAFYACAPELIARCWLNCAEANAFSVVLATAIAISTSWPIGCQLQPCCPHSPHFAAYVAL